MRDRYMGTIRLYKYRVWLRLITFIVITALLCQTIGWACPDKLAVPSGREEVYREMKTEIQRRSYRRSNIPERLEDISNIGYEDGTLFSIFFTGRGKKDGKRYWIKAANSKDKNWYIENEWRVIQELGYRRGDEKCAIPLFMGTVGESSGIYESAAGLLGCR